MKTLPWILFGIAFVIVCLTGAVVVKQGAEIKNLQTQLGEANANFKAATNDMEKMHELVDKYIALPNLPVYATWRKGVIDRGQVLVLHNTGDKSITVAIKWTNPTIGAKTGTVAIDPVRVTDIGQSEGFAFTSGDHAEISSKGYKAITVVAP